MVRQKSEPESELVSIRRAARMLGAALPQIAALYREGKIQMVDRGENREEVLTLQSIKMYCEELRADWGIERRRRVSSKEAAYLLNEDLLPFPLADTIGREEALSMLCSSTCKRIMRALESGAIGTLNLEMYRFTDADPFRVSRSSVIACLNRGSKASAPNEGI